MITTRCSLLQFVSFLFIIVSIGFCQNEIPGRALKLSRQTTTSAECPLGSSGPVCVGCSTLLTCDGVNVGPINSQTCSSQNPNYPYCSDGVCAGTSAPSGSDCSDVGYTCTGPGQFPDIGDCRRYIICDSEKNPTAFECPPNYVYNSKTGLCRRWPCQNVDCTKSVNKYIVYSLDPSVLIYCYNDGTTTKSLTFRCSDPKNMQYDPNTLKCSFKCTREGRFVDVMDCQSFYECYSSGFTFTFTYQSCPPGFAYNGTNQQCVVQTTCQNQIDGSYVDTLLP